MISPRIFEKLQIAPQSVTPVHGGDINKAFCITTATQQFFLKINKTANADMLVKEAKGLNILRAHTRLKVPLVLQTGSEGEYQFLLLEWLHNTYPAQASGYRFGQGVAQLHRHSQPCFGFEENNYIGTLHQVNTLTGNWPDFYAHCRILPLIKKLADSGQLSFKDGTRAETFCSAIKNIFPDEPPSLLHGDLWSGNYISASAHGFAIFDPAVYYGHREMDIAMTKLFGGFPVDFYTGYNDAYPLEKGWPERLPYAQLYPLLVHAVLFGGHYTANVRSILNDF
jgi:fructosamine-3-kinase